MADLAHALRDAFPEARPGRSSAVCDGFAAGLAYRLEEVTCPDCLRAIAEWARAELLKAKMNLRSAEGQLEDALRQAVALREELEARRG